MTPKDYREDWTEEEAWDAQIAYMVAGGSPSPNSPHSWWEGKKWLREHEAECEQRKPLENPEAMKTVLDAIELCAMHGWPIPEWAAQPYRYAIARMRHLEAQTWEEVFGKPAYLRDDEKQFAAASRRRALEWRVYSEVAEELKNPDGLRHGATRDRPDVCEDVGSRYGIGKDLASKYYYAVKERLEAIREAGERDRAAFLKR